MSSTTARPSRVRDTPLTGQHPPLLSPEELASFLGVPLKTVYRWRSRGEGPAAFKVGRHVRYGLGDVHAWLDSRRDRD